MLKRSRGPLFLGCLAAAVLLYAALLNASYRLRSRSRSRSRSKAGVTFEVKAREEMAGNLTRFRDLNRQRSTSLTEQRSTSLTGQRSTPLTSMTSEEEFAERRGRVQHVCQSGQVGGAVSGVFPLAEAGTIYCFVPKAGCTFWKRVHLLKREKKAVTGTSLFSLPRLRVHDLAKSGRKFVPTIHSPGRFPTRFLVVRDPFSRLVSAYLDKAYLPDFWATEIRGLLKEKGLRGGGWLVGGGRDDSGDFLRADLEKIQRLFGQGVAGTEGLRDTTRDKQCGKYATFREFIEAGIDREEPHWMPIYQICDPCLFSATHISRMETFTRDANALLGKMGVANAMDDLDTDAQVDGELQMIVDYNYNRTTADNLNDFYARCVTSRELAYRLWNNFRWRGYIHPDVLYKVPDFTDTHAVKRDLLAQIRMAREEGLEEPGAMKKMKEEFRMEAFRTLPRDLFEKLMEKYKTDFDLFGYEDLRSKYRSLYVT